MNTPSKKDLLQSIASRNKEMDEIHDIIKALLRRVKQLNQRHDELKSLNHLDNILLKEIEENGSN